MSPHYFLRHEIHFCESDDALIFLDVRRNAYFRFTGQQAIWFRQHFPDHSPNAPEPKALAFADHLVARRILTRDQALGKLIAPTPALQPAPCTLFQPQQVSSLRLADAIRMTRAVAIIWILERTRSFEKLALSVLKWKTSIAGAPRGTSSRIHDLCATFHRLSPFFFSTHEACRFRSLCLVRYLAFEGLQTDWVFGVRLSPFGAHCWVEHDGVVLNDEADTVREYRRIMSV